MLLSYGLKFHVCYFLFNPKKPSNERPYPKIFWSETLGYNLVRLTFVPIENCVRPPLAVSSISLDYLKMNCADFFFRSITYDLVRYVIQTAFDFMKFRALLSCI